MLKPIPILCTALHVGKGTTLYHSGPSLDKGPMPAVFYFALSGEDSLCLDPFNQVVQFLSPYPVRVFSLTLPGHEANLPKENAINIWAEDIAKGKNFFSTFFDSVIESIDFALRKNFTEEGKIAVAGLSRGGFIASHIAAIDPRIHFLLLFAPLTVLKNAKEFTSLQDNAFVESMSLVHLSKDLCERHVRAYIGNRDIRVNTRACFDFIDQLSEDAFSKKIRSPQVEMVISPSVGHQGHGTPPHIFQEGANWLAKCLCHN